MGAPNSNAAGNGTTLDICMNRSRAVPVTAVKRKYPQSQAQQTQSVQQKAPCAFCKLEVTYEDTTMAAVAAGGIYCSCRRDLNQALLQQQAACAE